MTMQKKTHWLQTLPGIISAISALIVAITGVLVYLSSENLNDIKLEPKDTHLNVIEDLSIKPGSSSLQGLFAKMEHAVKTGNESLFKSQWFTEGYTSTIGDELDMPGQEVFQQATRKKWFIRPAVEITLSMEKSNYLTLVCDIVSWEEQKVVDEVTFGFVKIRNNWIVVGASEYYGEKIESLAKRYNQIIHD